MEDIELTVVLGEPRNGAERDFVSCPPTIYVRVIPQLERGRAATGSSKLYSVLLDTGAEFCAIDELLVNEINAPEGRRATVHGFGQNALSTSIRVSIYSPCGRIQHNTDLIVQPSIRQNLNVDVILGRSFLKYCKLEINGPKTEYKLSWPTSSQ